MAAADIGMMQVPSEMEGSSAPHLDAAARHGVESERHSSEAPGARALRGLRGHVEGQDIAALFGDLVIDDSSNAGLITVDELERRYIERVLALTSGNKSRAAQILGFDRRTLYRKIERYGRSQ